MKVPARKIGLIIASTALLGLTACENMTSQERMIVGGLTGATVGALSAKALNADTDWVIIAALAGAVAGTLVARNQETGKCAYARGDGTYRIAACP